MSTNLQSRDLRLALMAGIDIPIPELQLTIHPPKIKDIAYIGERDFFSSIQYLCLDKEYLIQDKTISQSLTNFQVLMKALANSEKKSVLDNLLMVLFPEYKITTIPGRSFILSKEGSNTPVIIDDNNFDILQQTARQVLCVNSLFQQDNIIYKPANAAAKRIADKLMEGRRRAAELKSQEESNVSILTRYLSILTIGTNTLSINDCIELTLFQLFDLMERYTALIDWDIDLRVRLAGRKPEKEVETWMKDLHP